MVLSTFKMVLELNMAQGKSFISKSCLKLVMYLVNFIGIHASNIQNFIFSKVSLSPLFLPHHRLSF